MSQSSGVVTQPQNDARGVVRGLPPKWDNHTTFTIDEAAEILGVSRGTAYAAAAAGTLPIIRFGRRQVVPRAPFERLLGL